MSYPITHWYLNSIPYFMAISVPTHLFVTTMDLYEHPTLYDKPLTKMYILKQVTKSLCYGIANAVFFPVVFNYTILKIYMLQNEFSK